MAAFDPYPGAYQPAWWNTTATTTNAWVYPAQFVGGGQIQPKLAPAPVAKPKPRTNLDWLRERVAEVCELAELVPA